MQVGQGAYGRIDEIDRLVIEIIRFVQKRRDATLSTVIKRVRNKQVKTREHFDGARTFCTQP